MEVDGVAYCDVAIVELMTHPERYVDGHVMVVGYYDVEQMVDAIALRPESIHGPIIGAEVIEIKKPEVIEYSGPGYYVVYGKAEWYFPHLGGGGTTCRA